MASAFHRNLLTIALMAIPILFLFFHLWADRRYDLPSASFFVAILAGVATGSIGVWIIQTGRWIRLATLLIYVPTAILGLYLLGFLVTCGAHDVCL